MGWHGVNFWWSSWALMCDDFWIHCSIQFLNRTSHGYLHLSLQRLAHFLHLCSMGRCQLRNGTSSCLPVNGQTQFGPLHIEIAEDIYTLLIPNSWTIFVLYTYYIFICCVCTIDQYHKIIRFHRHPDILQFVMFSLGKCPTVRGNGSNG